MGKKEGSRLLSLISWEVRMRSNGRTSGIVQNGGSTVRSRAKQQYASAGMHCCLCGERFGMLYHYLRKTEDGKEFTAAHPLAPLLCETCARDKSKHGRGVCVVWEGAKCIVSDQALDTNATLH
jgi:hypothetical protein